MEFSFYAVTHSGLVRDNNEDYYSVPRSPSNNGLAVVADGMGGHRSGEVASKLAVDTFMTVFNSEPASSLQPNDRLIYALNESNNAVYSAAHEKVSRNNMGTTLTACYLEDGKATFVNVGDSRAYLIHNGELCQVTHDHSVVQELLLKDIITEEEAQTHPQKNVITRAIGIEPTVLGDIFIKDICEGDYIVLCTDGLTSHICIEELLILFDSTCTLESIANTLKDLALVKGGTDNITVIIIGCNRAAT